MFDLSQRHDFLTVALLFEGSFIGVASGLGWLLGIDPLAHWNWTLSGGLSGLAATVPMFALFLGAYRLRWPPFQRIRRFLREILGPPLSDCRWYELLLVAIAAGCGEELLFRGVLQPKLGIWFSNALFALAHAITLVYAVSAGLMGALLGSLLDVSGNLLAPVVTHSLYDFLAFLVVVHDVRHRDADGNRWPRSSE